MRTPEGRKEEEFRKELLSKLERLHKDLDSLDRSLKTAIDQSQTNRNSTDPQIQAVVVPESGLPPAVESYYQAEQNERIAKNRWTRIIHIIQIGGLIGILATVWVYGEQWKVMIDSLGQTQMSLRGLRRSLLLSEQQTKAAEIAANAAKRAADTAAKTLTLDQRAWMVPEFTGTHIDNSGYARQDAKIDNHGRTPAIHFYAEFMMVPVQADTVPQFDFPPWKYSAKGPVMFPNSPLPFSFGVVTGKSDNPEHAIPTTIDKAKFDRRELVLVVYGRVTYDDIFGRHHFSHICAPQWSQYTAVGYSTIASKACADYNQIDQEQ